MVTGALARRPWRSRSPGATSSTRLLAPSRWNGRGSFEGTRGPDRGLDLTPSAGCFTPRDPLSWATRRRGPGAEPSRPALGEPSHRRSRACIRASRCLPEPGPRGWRRDIDFDAREGYPPLLSRLRATATTILQPVAEHVEPRQPGIARTGGPAARSGTWSLRHSIRTSRAQASLEGTVTGRLLDDRSDQFGSTLGGRSRFRVEDVTVPRPSDDVGERECAARSGGRTGRVDAGDVRPGTGRSNVRARGSISPSAICRPPAAAGGEPRRTARRGLGSVRCSRRRRSPVPPRCRRPGGMRGAVRSTHGSR